MAVRQQRLLRIGELASLRWADIDLDNGLISITDESGRSGTQHAVRRRTKSGRGRSFPIHPDLLEVLKGIDSREEPIFLRRDGKVITSDTARDHFTETVIVPLTSRFPGQQGLKTFANGRFHSFRHYFCSTCANNNVPERMVMKWLGHSSSEMIRYYYHLHDEDAKQHLCNLDLLGRAGGRSAGEAESNNDSEDAGPNGPEKRDDVGLAD